MLVSSCSTKWMDKFIRDDFDKIEVTYFTLEPTAILPIPKKENCLKITGLSKDKVLDALNKRSSYMQFKECAQNPIMISFENTDDTAMGRNQNAQKLKSMGASAKGGNTLLGMLFLSSIETESEMVKAKGQVTIQHDKAVSHYPFETEYFDAHYVKSEKRPHGTIDLELEVLKKTESTIWQNLEPYWRERDVALKFDVKAEYLEDFRWDLHHEQYSRAVEKLNVLQLTHPQNTDIIFNKAILHEYFREYEQALQNYQALVKLNYSSDALVTSIDRVQKEIAYRKKISSINPGLLK